MNYIPNCSPVPNEILDQHLPHLNQAQLKVLLVVVRQVLGWIDPKTKKRKRKDWITRRFFHRRTGLTFKSISLAINELVRLNLIVTMDSHERILKTPAQRRGKKRIYYSYAPYYFSLKRKTWVDMLTDMFTFQPYTKHTHTKENVMGNKVTGSNIENVNTTVRRLSDRERYKQIINEQSQPPRF